MRRTREHRRRRRRIAVQVKIPQAHFCFVTLVAIPLVRQHLL